MLLLLPETPSLQLRTVLHEAVAEARLRHLGKMSSPETALTWDALLKNAATLPDFAARILMPEPELHRPIVGFRVCREAAKKLPASHKNTKTARRSRSAEQRMLRAHAGPSHSARPISSGIIRLSDKQTAGGCFVSRIQCDAYVLLSHRTEGCAWLGSKVSKNILRLNTVSQNQFSVFKYPNFCNFTAVYNNKHK